VEAVYYGHISCTFDDGICDGWMLISGMAEIVNTSTHNFTVSGSYTQNGIAKYSVIITNYAASCHMYAFQHMYVL